MSRFIAAAPLEWRGGCVVLRKDSGTLLKPVTLSPSLPEMDIQPLTRWLCIGKKEIIRPFGINVHWLWIDTNSRKSKISLWSTSQNRGLWRSGDQWSFGSGVSHSGPSGSPNPSCGYFPVPGWIIGIDVLSNSQNPCIGSLWIECYCRKGQVEATRTTFLWKIGNQKQYNIPGGTAEISATIKDLKHERVVIPTII